MSKRISFAPIHPNPKIEAGLQSIRAQNVYRVWMKDGCAGIYNALSVDEAKAVAFRAALKATKGAAMAPAELKRATTVDYVEQLN